MVSTYSDRLHLELMADGEKQGTWGQIANVQFEMLEEAVSGVGTVAHDDSAAYTLVMTNGTKSVDSTTNVARNMVLEITGALGAARNLEVPAEEKVYLVYNNTTDSGSSGPYAVTVLVNGQTGVSVPNGDKMLLYCNGTDVVNGITSLPSGTTIASPVLNTGVSGTAFIDDDSMATAGAAILASSESIKAYVDAQVGGAGLESGTVMLFYQAAAPTGWTRDTTTSAIDSHGLRVCIDNSGGEGAWSSGSNGGATLFDAAVNSAVTSSSVDPGNTNAGGTGNTGSASPTAASHTHIMNASNAGGAATPFIIYDNTGTGSGANTYNTTQQSSNADQAQSNEMSNVSSGGSSAHTHTGPSHTHTMPTHDHTTNIAMSYIDVILASKD